MKRKYLLMGIAGALVLSTIIGGTLAALNTSTRTAATAGIGTDSIGIQLTEERVPLSDGVKATFSPGGTFSIEKNVVNALTNETASTSNYSVYVKVVIYKSWEKAGEYIDVSATEDAEDTVYIGETAVDAKLLTPVAEGETRTDIVDNWLVSYADDEQIVMYYTLPVAHHESTTNFIDAIKFSEDMGNAYADAELNLEFEITAVQVNNGYDAIAAELGVFPTFAEDGTTIVSVSDTRPEVETPSEQVE